MSSKSVEGRIMAIIEVNKDLAIAEDELRFRSGLGGVSFREALIRLTDKDLIRKWKTERFVNYVVGSQYANQAYYEEVVATHPLSSLFGVPEGSFIAIRRSIPFVLLDDEETGKVKSNRYRDLDVA